MKINESQSINALNKYRQSSDQPRTSASKKQSRDVVNISAEAKEMLSAMNDSERASKIQKLKQSVSSGTYHVEAGKIAEKLLPYFQDKQ